MVYIAESYGVKTARSAGQYQESRWLGLWHEGRKAVGSSNVQSNADLKMNEVGLCISEKMAHADARKGVTDKVTRAEICECFKGADMKAIQQKVHPLRSGGDSTLPYQGCNPCKIKPAPPKLKIPPIDL